MLQACANSSNYHKRRLASEGLRPKLPWAKKLTIDYEKSIDLLNKLFSDRTRYVTRSVANHLNDIAKIDANLVIKTLNNWEKSKKQTTKEMDFIINHSLRTLIKKGNLETLEFLGYPTKPQIKVTNFKVENKKVYIGEKLKFSINIKAEKTTKLIIDYIISFQTKSGSFSEKVYKLKKLQLKKGETIVLSKKHLFKKNMSTRKLHKGIHKITIQINGRISKTIEFELC